MKYDKVFFVLKHLLIKAFLLWFIILIILPNGHGSIIAEVTLALYVFLFTLAGSGGFLYMLLQEGRLFSLPSVIFLMISILPIILLGIWYKSNSSSNVLLHIATALWVIVGGFIAFGMAISSI